MARKIFTLAAAALLCAAGTAGSAGTAQKSLDSILSKAGISFGGEFRSQFFGSTITGPGCDTTKRTVEDNEFTSVDFDIRARPNDNVSGRCVFRMHQNWQNFFSDIANPIFLRWLSIDGKVADLFRFNVGDFRARYSRLTLWSPEPEILYEPYIFARSRQIAMDEVFAGSNDRLLQGINLGFDAEIAPLFSEFHYGLTGARLRSNETFVGNGSLVVNKWQTTGNMTKFFVGNNLDLSFLQGAGLGASWLVIFDQKGTYRGSDTIRDTSAQLTQVLSLRPSVDIGKFLQNDALGLKLGAEAAFSLDDSTWFKDSVGMVNGKKRGAFFDTTIKGTAVRVTADARYSAGSDWSVGLEAAYLANGEKFRNELAQSPSFVPSRVMNIENDNPDSLEHYTTFDALYNSVFKFTPIAASNRWAKAPFMKNSWVRTIFTQSELDALKSSALDPSVQLVLPFGDATPNRQGPTLRLIGTALNNALEATVLFSQLAEKDLQTFKIDTFSYNIPKTDFSQVGGGLKIDIAKLAKIFPYRLEISGSYVISKATNDGIADTKARMPKWEITSSFLNFGQYYKFLKRVALISDEQLIWNSATVDTLTNYQVQTHWAAGFEWSIEKGIDVVATYGQIMVMNGKNRALLKTIAAVPSGKGFTQNQIDVSMRVKF